MRPIRLEWRLWLVIGSVIVALGWLDVVRGRELAVIGTNQQRVLHELDRIRDRLERLEARIGRLDR